MASFLERLFDSHQFDDWASEHTLKAAEVLNEAAAGLIAEAEEDLASARWKDGLIDPNAFITEKIAPRIRRVAEPLALMIIEDANRSLQMIVDAQAIWTRQIENAPLDGNSFDSAGDLATAIVPLGVGAATAAALPYAAVSTTTAFFGLVSTTTVSWPVLLGGSAIAGLGIATGLVESSKLWSKVEARLRRRTRAFIIAALLKGDAEHPSVLEQLAAEFQLTARRAKAVR